MNPWRIIGWIFLAFMVLMMYACYEGFRPRTEQEVAAQQRQVEASRPSYEFTVSSFECLTRAGWTEAKVTGRNTGSTDIPYAMVFVEIAGIADDTYFSPTKIPVGSLASASPAVQASGDCKLIGMQDGRGNPVTIR